MTSWVNVEKDTWTKVADGQCTLQKVTYESILIYIGDTAPDDTSPYGIWRDDEFSYGGVSTVYIKSPVDTRITVFSE